MASSVKSTQALRRAYCEGLKAGHIPKAQAIALSIKEYPLMASERGQGQDIEARLRRVYAYLYLESIPYTDYRQTAYIHAEAWGDSRDAWATALNLSEYDISEYLRSLLVLMDSDRLDLANLKASLGIRDIPESMTTWVEAKIGQVEAHLARVSQVHEAHYRGLTDILGEDPYLYSDHYDRRRLRSFKPLARVVRQAARATCSEALSVEQWAALTDEQAREILAPHLEGED